MRDRTDSMAGSSGSSTNVAGDEHAPVSASKEHVDEKGPTESGPDQTAQYLDEKHDLEKAAGSDVEKEEEKPPGPMDPRSFPDGGFEAWLVISGAWCCLICSFGWINALGIFQTYYETHQLENYSPSTIAWIPSLETFMMFAGGPFFGKIYDNYGPRYLLLAGTFFNVFGLMMTSLCKEYYQFVLAQGICNPLGTSMLFYPALTTASSWFFKRRAFALGIVASGSSLGGVIFPIMVQRLIPKVGFGWTMRICAFMMLGLLIYANLTVKSRLPPTKRPWNFMEFITPLKEIPFVLTVLASFIFFFGMFLPFTFVILSAQHDGMGANLASYLLSILNAVSIFGRVLPGFLADKFGRFNAMIFISYLSAILVLALWLPARGNVPYILFAAFFGFSSGAFVSIVPALVAQISDVRQIGVRTGTMFFIISIAALFGIPIGGALVSDEHGQYTHLQIFTGVMMLGGSTFFLFARASQAGFKLKKI